MKKMKRIAAGALSISLIAALSACGGGGGTDTGTTTGGSEEATTTAPVVTTTRATVEVNTTGFNDEEKAIIEKAGANLPEIELENKTIKWFAHYDKNPNDAGQVKGPALELFETKYGGKIEWIPTTWETRYSDLSTKVLGGEGMDFWPGDDTSNYPKNVISGILQPVDDYIDLTSPLWDKTRNAMELINFGGKHFEFITSVTSEAVVAYSQQTIEENGLDDPYEQWKEGTWNWDTFKKTLNDYCDPDNDLWGLDGWYNEKALFLSAGVPLISSTNGELTLNIGDPTVEKAMNYMWDLYQGGLVLDASLFNWVPQALNVDGSQQFLKDGRELFYIGGTWHWTAAPEAYSAPINPEDLRIVPVPSPAGSESFQAATLGGYALLKGASNPKGVAAYVECELACNADPDVAAIGDRQWRDTYMLPEEFITANKEINDMVSAHPVIDLSSGCGDDIDTLAAKNSESAMRATFHGITDWATTREMYEDTLKTMLADVNSQLQTAVSKF
jgi:hypothetical protein